MIAFESIIDQETHFALVKGNIENGEDVLVRVHAHCLTGDVFGSLSCHCQEQMDLALEVIENAGRGVLLYLRQMGKSSGCRTGVPRQTQY
jgi:3,4-dihydroxy 2-butanone 4-phosphate synthase/GTP cyclohydrolase II